MLLEFLESDIKVIHVSKGKVEIRYDKDADAMYIRFKQSKVHKTKKVNDYTLLDYDKAGNVLGIEILFVKENMPSLLGKVSVENLSI